LTRAEKGVYASYTLDAFREQHLAFVAGLKNDNGLWMDVQTRFAKGRKPEIS
jgi:hypothetical protein